MHVSVAPQPRRTAERPASSAPALTLDRAASPGELQTRELLLKQQHARTHAPFIVIDRGVRRGVLPKKLPPGYPPVTRLLAAALAAALARSFRSRGSRRVSRRSRCASATSDSFFLVLSCFPVRRAARRR